jgi:hypothetical protein
LHVGDGRAGIGAGDGNQRSSQKASQVAP